MKMMLLFMMINISFLSRQVEGQITISTSTSGYVVQLTCTSEAPGGCTRGSWLSNKTGATLGSCIQECVSNIGVENKFNSSEVSLIATIVNWNWTDNNNVWKCQCGTDTAVIVVTPPQTTTVAPESATTTEVTLLENATMSVTSSSDNNTGLVVGGVGGVILVCAVLAVLFFCRNRIHGRCLTRRKKQEEEIDPASSPMMSANTPSREQPAPQTSHQFTSDFTEEEINSASSPMMSANLPSREQPAPQTSHQFTSDFTEEEINSASSPMMSANTPSREQPAPQTSHQFTSDFTEEEINSASSPMMSANLPSIEQPAPQTSHQFTSDFTNRSYGATRNRNEVSEEERLLNWELGNPDYMDRDRFSNVRRKLDQTMNRDTHLPS